MEREPKDRSRINRENKFHEEEPQLHPDKAKEYPPSLNNVSKQPNPQ